MAEKSQTVIASGKPSVLVSSLIEHCIIPRCLLSPMDADFCARFIMTIHLCGTPGFPTLLCYDKVRPILIHRTVELTTLFAAYRRTCKNNHILLQ